MFKKMMIILPAIAVLAIVASPARAAKCSPQEIKHLETSIDHLRERIVHEKKDPNQARREHAVKRLEDIGRGMFKDLESCKKGERRRCPPQEVKSFKNHLEHLGKAWTHIMMNPNENHRRQELSRLNGDGEHIAKRLEICLRRG